MTNMQKQLLLAYMGYLAPADIDGIWGSQSARALEMAQERLGITADGIWGPRTEAAILGYIAGDPAAEEVETGTFWDHIRYWTREEFRCRCGEYHTPYCNGFPVEPDETLVELVDDLRHTLGAPGHRSSGIRCRQHNTDSGGVSNSRHMEGKALDFRIEGVSAEQVCQLAKRDPRTSYTYVIGNGPYVHVDVK